MFLLAAQSNATQCCHDHAFLSNQRQLAVELTRHLSVGIRAVDRLIVHVLSSSPEPTLACCYRTIGVGLDEFVLTCAMKSVASVIFHLFPRRRDNHSRFFALRYDALWRLLYWCDRTVQMVALAINSSDTDLPCHRSVQPFVIGGTRP